MLLYKWNTLDDAASWLSNELGNIALTARQVLELGVRGKAALHAVVPEGSIPRPSGRGFGVLKDFYEGFVQLSPNDCHVIAGRGSARFSSVDHPSDPNKPINLNHTVELNQAMLRISGDELSRNKNSQGGFHAAVPMGLIWNPSVAARRFSAAMLRSRCCSS